MKRKKKFFNRRWDRIYADKKQTETNGKEQIVWDLEICVNPVPSAVKYSGPFFG
jgi:hypothetical protein